LFDKIRNLFLRTKDPIFLGTSQITKTIISAGFWLYVASLLSKEDYGELNYYISLAMMGSTIALFGLDRTIIV